MRFLVNTTEVYRVDTEAEGAALINEAKQDSSYILSKYSSTKKERKAKGEVIDEWYHVQLVKVFNDEKDPIQTTNIIYEVE